MCVHTHTLYLSELIESCRHKALFTPKYFLKQEHSLREQWYNYQNQEINLDVALESTQFIQISPIVPLMSFTVKEKRTYLV